MQTETDFQAYMQQNETLYFLWTNIIRILW